MNEHCDTCKTEITEHYIKVESHTPLGDYTIYFCTPRCFFKHAKFYAKNYPLLLDRLRT